MWSSSLCLLARPGQATASLSQGDEDLSLMKVCRGYPSRIPSHPSYPNLPSTRPCRFHPLPGRKTSPSIFTCLLFLPRLVVGAPLETNGHQKTGDVYKCPVTEGNCTKLNLGNVGCLQEGQPLSTAGRALKHVPAPSHTAFSWLPQELTQLVLLPPFYR